MKAKKNNQRQKKHKPNLKGPYSVEPKNKTGDSFLDEEEESEKSKKNGKKDPAIIDRQE
jgi:hypothetical protein